MIEFEIVSFFLLSKWIIEDLKRVISMIDFVNALVDSPFLSFLSHLVRVPDAQIFIRNYTTTSIHIAWPETTDQQASSYLIYFWPSGGREPSASDHLYHGINRAESFASRRLGPLMVGMDYDIKVVVTGAKHVMRTKQRTSEIPFKDPSHKAFFNDK